MAAIPVFVRDETEITVGTVTLDETAAELKALTTYQADASMKAQINSAVPGSVGAEILVFVEGHVGGACGYTSSTLVVIPIENCSIAPSQGAMFPYGATYLVAHELTHLLGAVPGCAPNAIPGGHVGDDPKDILYQGGQPRDWDNLTLDPGRDDYFEHDNDGCTDISTSPLLGTWSAEGPGGESDSCPGAPIPFVDVSTTSFAYHHITCIYGLGVTTGTGPTTYDPGGYVTREQMAAFLARLYRAITGDDAPTATIPFTDVTSASFAYSDIGRIYGLGVTTGTGPTTYDPGGYVTREQMAAFLARLYRAITGDDAPTATIPFTDVTSASFAYSDIGRIYGLGVTTGTGPDDVRPGRLRHPRTDGGLPRPPLLGAHREVTAGFRPRRSPRPRPGSGRALSTWRFSIMRPSTVITPATVGFGFLERRDHPLRVLDLLVARRPHAVGGFHLRRMDQGLAVEAHFQTLTALGREPFGVGDVVEDAVEDDRPFGSGCEHRRGEVGHQ